MPRREVEITSTAVSVGWLPNLREKAAGKLSYISVNTLPRLLLADATPHQDVSLTQV
jgi:hypothetical protein